MNNKEKTQVVDEILTILRGQRDDRQKVEVDGQFTFVPADEFSQGEGSSLSHKVFGPIDLTTQFNTAPNITFGQGVQRLGGAAASTTSPFLVQPYLFSWKFTGAKVIGFWIGLQALSKVPLTKTGHVIYWQARGKGSAYKRERLEESWTSAYNLNNIDFLID